MDTWYLAGNCIDTTGFRGIVDSIVEQKSAVSNIWLKRNPLGPNAAADVARLIIGAMKLDTLDLDQTELSDEGVALIFNELSDSLEYGAKINLRHIYLNAVGIGLKASQAIGRFLASPLCQLESLFIANNPVGDEGATLLASGLAKEPESTAFHGRVNRSDISWCQSYLRCARSTSSYHCTRCRTEFRDWRSRWPV